MDKAQKTIQEYQAIISQQERQIYNLSQLLEISKSFASALESPALLEGLLYACMGQLHVMGAGIFSLARMGTSEFSLGDKCIGFDILPHTTYVFKDSGSLILHLCERGTCVSMGELKAVLEGSEDLTLLESLDATLVVPMLYQNHIVGVLVLGQRIPGEEGRVFTPEEKEQILDIATLAALSINTSMLIEQSSTDMLTHLKLRHFFCNVAAKSLRIARESSTPLAIVMLDIDHFKKFNDIYGHSCGDFVLQRIAHLLQINIRHTDLAARYGGEEFVIMLNNVTHQEAGMIAERIRSTVEHDDIVFSDMHMQVTLSAGYTVFYPEEMADRKITLEHLVNLADEAMYTSKHNGRNQVTYLPLGLLG